MKGRNIERKKIERKNGTEKEAKKERNRDRSKDTNRLIE